MSTPVKFFGVILGVPAVVIGLLVVNAFVYPFSSKHPNFSDVDQAFSKLQFPSDWQEISSSENRGIAGRGCDPFNSSGCFHKSKTFKVNNVPVAKEQIKEILKSQGGCTTILEEASPEGNSNTDPKTATNMKCVTNTGVAYLASTSLKRGEVGVTSTTSY